MAIGTTVSLLVVSCLVVAVRGNGWLLSPPGRASMWKYGYDNPENSNHMSVNCGGKEANGGQCGVCGDDFSEAQPRDHEGGGKYGRGTIVQTYMTNTTITVLVTISSPHQGWFEFRLCPNNDPCAPATQACLDQYLLVDATGNSRFDGITASRNYGYDLQLPLNLECDHCLLQWKYHTAKDWGCDVDQCGVGLGSQEEFYGCADVAITAAGTAPAAVACPDPVTPAPVPATCDSYVATGPWTGNPSMDQWCVTNCGAGYCPASTCQCVQLPG